MINIDFWYGHTADDITRIDIFFNDLTCKYSGNMYMDGRAVGDYTATSCADIEKAFNHLTFKFY